MTRGADDPVHRLKVICRQKYLLFNPSVSYLRIIYLKYFQLFFFALAVFSFTAFVARLIRISASNQRRMQHNGKQKRCFLIQYPFFLHVEHLN